MWRELNGEDVGIVAQLQRGRLSSGFDGGVFSDYWDSMTCYFNGFINKTVRTDGFS